MNANNTYKLISLINWDKRFINIYIERYKSTWSLTTQLLAGCCTACSHHTWRAPFFSAVSLFALSSASRCHPASTAVTILNLALFGAVERIVRILTVAFILFAVFRTTSCYPTTTAVTLFKSAIAVAHSAPLMGWRLVLEIQRTGHKNACC